MTTVSSIHTTRLGLSGGFPTLLAHCFMGHGGAWKRLVQAMATPLDALAVDMPGHGRSAPWDGKGDLHATATAALAERLMQPSLVIGHSFGATLALRLAMERPDRVTGLVLIEPVLFAAVRGSPEWQDHISAEAPMNQALAHGDLAAAAAAFFAINGDTAGWAALPDTARATIVRQMAMVAATIPVLRDDSEGLLADGRLEGLAMPVLLLAGEASPPIFRAVPKALALRIPDSVVQLVPGGGHMVPITHPAATAALIDPWLERVTPGKSTQQEKAKPRVG